IFFCEFDGPRERKVYVEPPGVSALAQRRDVDLPLARSVELAEEDSLVGTERKLALRERNEYLRAHQRGPDVRGRIRSVGVLDMLPVPAVVDDLLQRRFEILRD